MNSVQLARLVLLAFQLQKDQNLSLEDSIREAFYQSRADTSYLKLLLLAASNPDELNLWARAIVKEITNDQR